MLLSEFFLSYHPFIDGLHPRIHVDIDESRESSDDSSFDDAGDVVPRSGAVPKSTAGSTPLEQTPCHRSTTVEQEEGGGIKTRGEHEEQIATAAGVHIMPIGRKHRRLFLFRIRWRRGPSVTYKQEESVAAEPRKIWGYGRGEKHG